MRAPFVPQLNSITDTSYFPTEDLENVPDAPAVAAQRQQKTHSRAEGSKENLPFIGYTYKRLWVLSQFLLMRSDYLTRKNAL